MSKKLGVVVVGLLCVLFVLWAIGIFASDSGMVGTWKHESVDTWFIIDSVEGGEAIYWIRVDGSLDIPARSPVNKLGPVLEADFVKTLAPDRRIR